MRAHIGKTRLDLLVEGVGADAVGEADPGEDPRGEIVVEELMLEVGQSDILCTSAKVASCIEKPNLYVGLIFEFVKPHFTKLWERAFAHTGEQIAENMKAQVVPLFLIVSAELDADLLEDADDGIDVAGVRLPLLLTHDAANDGLEEGV